MRAELEGSSSIAHGGPAGRCSSQTGQRRARVGTGLKRRELIRHLEAHGCSLKPRRRCAFHLLESRDGATRTRSASKTKFLTCWREKSAVLWACRIQKENHEAQYACP